MSRRVFRIEEETRPFSSVRTNAIVLKRILDECDSVLDVGCGAASPLKFLSCRRLVGVEAYEPDLERARVAGTHDEFVQADARMLGQRFKRGAVDACVAMHVIEHFTKESGLEFLRSLEGIATRKVVVGTPNGFLPQASRVKGDLQEHLSGWSPDEMRRLGYSVIGLNGLKCLRTTHHALRFRPVLLWAVISWFTHHCWCSRHPESAAAILCVKEIAR